MRRQLYFGTDEGVNTNELSCTQTFRILVTTFLGYPDRITVNGGALRNNNNNKTTMALAGIYQKDRKLELVDLFFFFLK